MDFAGTARMAAVGFAIGGKGYVGTGINWATGPFDDMWQYDPALNTWTQKASANVVSWHQSVASSLNSKEYIGTGHNINSPNNNFSGNMIRPRIPGRRKLISRGLLEVGRLVLH